MYFGEIGEIGVPTGSWEKNCYKASANPEFGSTLERRVFRGINLSNVCVIIRLGIYVTYTAVKRSLAIAFIATF